MINKETLRQTAEQWMGEKGFFLVDLKVGSDNRISIEMETERGSVDIDDCAALNDFIESRFDRDVEDYSLEISSAGLGQPFKVRKQYLKCIGQDVEVSLKDGHRFVGILQAVNDDSFCVNVIRKVKPEGAKRPVSQAMDETYRYEEVNSVCYHLEF